MEHILPDDDDPNLQMFVNAVTEIATDLNRFDKTKYPCAVCDEKGHTFDTCPALKKSNIAQLYLKLLLLCKRFVKGLRRLDPAGDRHHHDLKAVSALSLAELDALETLEHSPMHTVSSLAVSQEDQLTEVVHLLRESVTPLLNNHGNVITNLASVMTSASGGASTHPPNNPNTTNDDDNSNGSTNTDSIASINTLAMNRLLNFRKAGHGK